MRKIVLAVSILAFLACEEEKPKDYVTFSGTITNKSSDSIVIRKRGGLSKTIKVNENGTFNDTLKVETGMYSFYDGNESTTLFLKNGYNINMTLNTKEFDETIKYTGEGSENNNFLAEQVLLQEQLFDGDFDSMTEEELSSTLDASKTKYIDFIDKATTIDTIITNNSRNNIDGMVKSYKKYYGGIIALRKYFPKGSPSPVFKNYENFKGGTTSLADLKGKYVYVDVWATWCGPCKAEIPSLKKVEAAFHDKNIAFVSMSIDDDRRHKGSWEKANESWRAMVADKELGGIQLFAPKGWNSDFIKGYKVNGIPRFILIDPEGNVVDPNAPRPSDPKLTEMLQSLI